jgi:hypothetical protein
MKYKKLRTDGIKPISLLQILSQIEFCLYCPAVKYITSQAETEWFWEIRLFKGGTILADGLLGGDPV